MLGRSARVFVDQNGERVEYSAANSSKLSQYIQMLKNQINRANFIPPGRVFL